MTSFLASLWRSVTPRDHVLIAAALCAVAFVVVAPIVARQLSRGIGSGRDAATLPARRATLAATAGVSAIVGGTLAYGTAGPATLPWIWLASLLGGGALALEAALSARAGARRPDDVPHGLGEIMIASGGRAARPLAWLHGLLAAFTLVVAFALVVSGEASRAVASLTDGSPGAAGLVMAALAVPLVFMPRRTGRNQFLSLLPFMLIAWVALCVIAIAGRPETLGEVLGEVFGIAAVPEEEVRAPVSTSTAGLAGMIVSAGAFVGLSRGLLAGLPGLGAVAALPQLELERPPRPGVAALSVLAAPLVGGLVVSTVTMFALAAVDAPQQRRIDERTVPEEYAELDISPDVLSPHVVVPGPPHARGLEPHLTYGQLIVLPEDTPLEHRRRYPMMFRSSARGNRTGSVDPKRNAVVLPAWEIARNVDTVVFRSRDPEMSQHAGFDRRIAVERESAWTWRKEDLEKPENERQDVEVYELHPRDPDVDLETLAKQMDGPYVVLDDFHFMGTVLKARNETYGDFLAMYEDRGPLAPENPVLRTIVSAGFVGPFFDTDPHLGDAPLVLASEPGFTAPVGSVVEMRMTSPPRGMSMLKFGDVVRKDNPQGELRTPAWDFLASVRYARLRHREDPEKDLLVPVEHRLAEDGSLRFWSADPGLVQFWSANEMKLFESVALEVPDYVFEMEVRSGARLPPAFSDRMALVPIDDRPEPDGAHDGLYRPHPMEVFAVDMSGPWIDQRRGAWLGASLRQGTGDLTTASFFAALLTVLLGVAGLTVVACAGGRSLEAVLGPGAAVGFQAVFLAAAAFAPSIVGDDLLRLALILLGITVPLGCLVAVLAWLRGQRASS